jgi:2',3'-cyclic-nucleotide 2'-phosphodiesterase (5'-nucleotidase family)
MSQYIKHKNGLIEQYPYFLSRLEIDFPSTSFPLNPSLTELSGHGIDVVEPTTPPLLDSRTQKAEQTNPVGVFVDNAWKWTQTWGVIDLTVDEKTELYALHSNVVRSERNAKLSATDWTQVADAPVDQAAWATYRQALRDITTQADFPWSIEWPKMP